MIVAIVSVSMYSSTVGVKLLATIAGTAAATSASESKGASTVAAWPIEGLQLDGHFGHEGERTLRPDDDLGEVVAGRGLHELAAGADHLARAEDHLEPEDVVPRHPVTDRPHPAGIRVDVAPERGALLAWVDRVDESFRTKGGFELGERDARLDDGDVVRLVDLEDVVHAGERDDEAAGHGDASAGQARGASSGRERQAGLAGEADDLAATSAVEAGMTTASGRDGTDAALRRR